MSRAARCAVTGCQNFGNPAHAGKCNGCASGKAPAIDPGRVAEEAAVLAETSPNDAATVAMKLQLSLDAARSYADDCPPDSRRPPVTGTVPFALQRKVGPSEKMFKVLGDIYVGSEYAAADVSLLRGLGVSRVINITSGSRTVPNFGERVDGWDVSYIHHALEDRIGFPVDAIYSAIVDSASKLEQWRSEGRVGLVHCSAGLCRSASVIMGWLMLDSSTRMTLGEAVAAFTAARGRPPACSPSFWSALVRIEKSQRESAGMHGKDSVSPASVATVSGSELMSAASGGAGATSSTSASTSSTSESEAAPYTPSYNFTQAVCDDLGAEAGSASLQLAPDAEISRLLVSLDWDADAVFRHLMS